MSKGIYKITNKINNKCYIGKSINIEERWKYHIRNIKSSREFDKPLYRAFRKNGISNFSFEIIEELEKYEDIANEREKYWIKYFDCYGADKGYNATIGGDGGQTCSNYRKKYGKLSEEEVFYIRERYKECKYPKSYIYKYEFVNKISERGFSAIWTGQNSKDIHYDVYTEENKKKQLILSRKYEGVLKRKISLEETLNIRERIKNG